MFALKSENKSNTTETKNSKKSNVTDKILFIYKKLKKIAQYELNLKNKFKLADLNNARLNKLKSLESDLGICLVAYEEDNFSSQKLQILTQINSLLNDYSKLITKDDFSKFFE